MTKGKSAGLIFSETSLQKTTEFGKRPGNLNLKALVQTPPLPISIPNSQSYAISDEEKSNAIAANFESQFQWNSIVNINVEKEVNESVRHFSRTEIEFPTFRIAHADVYKEIKKPKNKKAPGISGITNEALKNLPTQLYSKNHPFNQ